ncbi:hypothetical protein JL721_12317 [Aureococcus anophagefferens]|nr:hypothetical protein JL721_12317 [Aureococcus anophagefferens]
MSEEVTPYVGPSDDDVSYVDPSAAVAPYTEPEAPTDATYDGAAQDAAQDAAYATGDAAYATDDAAYAADGAAQATDDATYTTDGAAELGGGAAGQPGAPAPPRRPGVAAPAEAARAVAERAARARRRGPWVIDEAGVHTSESSLPARILNACPKWKFRRQDIVLEDLEGMPPHAACLVLRKLAEEALRSEVIAQSAGRECAATLRGRLSAEARSASFRDLDETYVQPDRAAADAKRRARLFEGGRNGAFGSTESLERLGVGVKLFFEALRVSSAVLLVMGVCYVPVMVLNGAGNGGYALSSSAIAAAADFGMIRLSLANQGLDPDAFLQGGCACPESGPYAALIDQGVDIKCEAGGHDCRCNERRGLTSSTICKDWRDLDVYGQDMKDKTMTTWISCFCFLAACAVVAGAIAFALRLNRLVSAHRKANAEPSDYTVMVRGLPEDATIAEIRDHFSALYDLSKPMDARAPTAGVDERGVALAAGAGFVLVGVAAVFAAPAEPAAVAAPVLAAAAGFAYARKKRRKGRAKASPYRVAPDATPPPITVEALDAESDVLCADFLSAVLPVSDAVPRRGQRAVLGSWVADVQLSHPFGALIRGARAKIKTVNKEAALRARVQKLKAKGGSLAKVGAAMKKFDVLVAKQAQYFDKLVAKHDPRTTMARCGVAFVTFEHEESAFRCLDDYRASKILDALLPARGAPVPRREALRVGKAPAPSNVIWENLEHSRRRPSSARAARATPDKLKCDNLPAAFTGSYQNLTNELVHFGDGACPAGYEHFEYAGLDYADLPVLAMGLGLPPMNRTDAGLEVDETLAADLQCDHDGGRFSKSHRGPRCRVCDGACAPKDTDDDPSLKCYSLACYGRPDQDVTSGWLTTQACFEYHPALLTACYCSYNLGLKKTWYILTGRKDRGGFDVCEDAVKASFVALLAQLVVAVLVIVVNEATRVAIYALVDVEHHVSHTKRLSSLVLKLTSSMFVNTALIALAVNAYLDPDDARKEVRETSEGSKLFSGNHANMGKKWYGSVGAALGVTMIMNVFVPQISFVQKVVVAELKRVLLRSGATTQQALDALYRPPRWEVERSYAIVLNTMLVSLFYAAGMPLLIPMAAVALFLSYGRESLLLKCVDQPPNFDETLGIKFAKYFLAMALVHVAMAAYILSEEELLHSGSFASGEKIAQHGSRPDWQIFAIRRMSRHNVVLFVILFAVFFGLALVYAVVGRPAVLLFYDACALCNVEVRRASLDHVYRHTGFTAPWRSVVFHPKLRKGAKKEVVLANFSTIYRRWRAAGATPNGARHRKGDVQRSWEVMAETHLVDYNIVNNPEYADILAVLDENGKAVDAEAAQRPDRGTSRRRRRAALAPTEEATGGEADGEEAAAT